MPALTDVVQTLQIDPKHSGYLMTVQYVEGYMPTQTEHGVETDAELLTWLQELWANPEKYVTPAL